MEYNEINSIEIIHVYVHNSNLKIRWYHIYRVSEIFDIEGRSIIIEKESRLVLSLWYYYGGGHEGRHFSSGGTSMAAWCSQQKKMFWIW